MMQKKCSGNRQNWDDVQLRRPVLGALGPFRAHLSCRRHQMVSHFPQVGQCKQHLQLRRVLGQTPVAHFGKAELAFDDAKRMLHTGTKAGLGAFVRFPHLIKLAIAQQPPLARHHRDMPPDGSALVLFALLNTSIARIPQDDLFLTVQQRMGLRDIVNIGCGADDGMHQAIHVHSDVSLHAEVPLIALLGLMHLGVTGARRVLGGSGSINDRRVDNRALAHRHALVGQQQVDRLKC